MKKVEIYTVDYCPYCKKAVDFLTSKKVDFVEHDITADEDRMRKMLGEKFHIEGRVTVPRVVIDGKHIGGYDNLLELEASKELDKLLQ